MTGTDRSTEALLARRAIAEQATPGPWANTDTVKELFHAAPCDWWNIYASGETIDLSYLIICRMSPRATEEEEQAARKISWADRNKMYDPGQAGKDAAHIAANSPDVVMDDIDEILHLRADVSRLERERDWLANRLACIKSGSDIKPETFDRGTESWIHAAGKAVEETCPKN